MKIIMVFNTQYMPSRNGHLNILVWFYRFKSEFKFSKYAIIWAQYYEHHDVIQWFNGYNSNQPISSFKKDLI